MASGWVTLAACDTHSNVKNIVRQLVQFLVEYLKKQHNRTNNIGIVRDNLQSLGLHSLTSC